MLGTGLLKCLWECDFEPAGLISHGISHAPNNAMLKLAESFCTSQHNPACKRCLCRKLLCITVLWRHKQYNSDAFVGGPAFSFRPEREREQCKQDSVCAYSKVSQGHLFLGLWFSGGFVLLFGFLFCIVGRRQDYSFLTRRRGGLSSRDFQYHLLNVYQSPCVYFFINLLSSSFLFYLPNHHLYSACCKYILCTEIEQWQRNVREDFMRRNVLMSKNLFIMWFHSFHVCRVILSTHSFF